MAILDKIINNIRKHSEPLIIIAIIIAIMGLVLLCFMFILREDSVRNNCYAKPITSNVHESRYVNGNGCYVRKTSQSLWEKVD